jgi:predicted Zn-dependent protease with MMP-like domain
MEIDDRKWELLFDQAQKVVQQTIAAMPAELRAEAERVPFLLEQWPPDGEEVLGRCLSFEENVISEAPGPLLLYLGTIYEDCEELGLDFADEVRITFLHELGHLGLDEGDLAERGLL